MAVNKRFKLKKKVDESTYKDRVAGSNKLGKGTHTVTLTSVEEVESDEWHAYDLIWQDAEGATFKERSFITYVDRETQEREISNKFHKMCLALTNNDHSLAQDFFLDSDNGAYCDVDKMSGAVGCKVIINIGLPNKGVSIKNVNNEMFAFDIETGDIIDEIGAHSDIKEIIAATKELGLSLKFNQVRSHRADSESAETNQSILQGVLSDAETAPVSIANETF